MKKSYCLMIPMVLGLMSCEPSVVNKNTEQRQPDKTINTKKNALENDLDYAQRLTRVGEILINNPVGFSHANDLFNDALKLDPGNDKALFYSALTGIVMKFEGAAKRMKKFYDKPEDYDEMLNSVKENFKYPEFVKFITGRVNTKEFRNVHDIKRFVQMDITDAFESAAKKLNMIDQDVELIITQLKTDNTEIEYDCHEITEDDSTYTTCSLKEQMDSVSALPAQINTVDTKDIKIISSGLKAYATAFKLYTGYSLEGTEQFNKETETLESQLGRELTEKENHQIVKKYNNLFTLERDHRWNEVVADLEGMIYTAMDLETLNNRFCDTGLRESNLIKTICFDEDSREVMQKALDYLSGPQEISIGKDENNQDVKIMIDLPAYLSNPLEDLKSLLPIEYNEDGTGIYLQEEPELNGLFPNKDLLEKIKQLKSEYDQK